MGKTVILGAGIAGLSAAYHLEKEGCNAIVFEQNDYTGGLCHSFKIDGFTFDTFIHLSFTKDATVRELFDSSVSDYLCHPPESMNYWHGYWLRHPVQNNLYPLPTHERVNIIKSFLNRPIYDHYDNYAQWLYAQYGEYFAEKFPFQYNMKYWCSEPADMETMWVGDRMYCPVIDEILHGALEQNSINTYYANEMRYPKKGGFQSFLSKMESSIDVQLNKKVVRISPEEKTVSFVDGDTISYNKLISTIPMPEICNILPVPTQIISAAKKLTWTSGAIVSIGLKSLNAFPFENAQLIIPPVLWFYVYDKDILFSRVYYSSRKSPNNAPEGCSALQAEIYFSSRVGSQPDLEKIRQDTLDSLVNMKIIKMHDVLFSDIRYEKYANIVFNHSIYESRKIVLDYLEKQGIISAGRFGEWDYFWSDQSVLSGKRASIKVLE